MKRLAIISLIFAAGTGLTGCAITMSENEKDVFVEFKHTEQIFKAHGIKIDCCGVETYHGETCVVFDVENSSGKDIDIFIRDAWINNKTVEVTKGDDSGVSTYTFKLVRIPYTSTDEEVESIGVVMEIFEQGGAMIDTTGVKRISLED